MALTVGDILQCEEYQTYLGQVCLNVFYYQLDAKGATADYDEVNNAFAVNIIAPMCTLQDTGVAHTRTVFKNLTNALDIAEYPHSDTGDVDFEDSPSFLAAGFRLIRSTALTRHGSKRVVGITEGAYTGNTPSAGFIILADALAVKFGAQIVYQDGLAGEITMSPVIVGRFPVGHAQAGELDLSKINPVASAQFIRITTQNSRKAGRGT